MGQIDPHIFARVMGLPTRQRHDMLEFLGQTALPPGELDRLLTRLEQQAEGPKSRIN